MGAHAPIEPGRSARACDRGPAPFVTSTQCTARKNQNFRTAIWTGEHLQMTVMHIPPRGDLGAELHPNTDQYLRVEAGQALVRMGDCPESADIQRRLNTGDAVLIPGGTWHNIINIGNCPLKLSSLYAPPQHSRGTVHCTQADAAHEDH